MAIPALHVRLRAGNVDARKAMKAFKLHITVARFLEGALATEAYLHAEVQMMRCIVYSKHEVHVWMILSMSFTVPAAFDHSVLSHCLLGLQVEEFYVITWEAKKEQVFEMPTGGAAIMRSGPNLLKLARKEQCLALLSQLRTKFKTDGQFYRVFPDGEVQYLHPKDGVYPEKVNQGRQAVGANDRSIGKNPNPISVSVGMHGTRSCHSCQGGKCISDDNPALDLNVCF